MVSFGLIRLERKIEKIRKKTKKIQKIRRKSEKIEKNREIPRKIEEKLQLASNSIFVKTTISPIPFQTALIFSI